MIFYFYSILVHCRNLHPIFRKVAEKYRENDKIIFARMDLGEFKPFDLKVSMNEVTKIFALLCSSY